MKVNRFVDAILWSFFTHSVGDSLKQQSASGVQVFWKDGVINIQRMSKTLIHLLKLSKVVHLSSNHMKTHAIAIYVPSRPRVIMLDLIRTATDVFAVSTKL